MKNPSYEGLFHALVYVCFSCFSICVFFMFFYKLNCHKFTNVNIFAMLGRGVGEG